MKLRNAHLQTGHRTYTRALADWAAALSDRLLQRRSLPSPSPRSCELAAAKSSPP